MRPLVVHAPLESGVSGHRLVEQTRNGFKEGGGRPFFYKKTEGQMRETEREMERERRGFNLV
jgi:hypothetical protein